MTEPIAENDNWYFYIGDMAVFEGDDAETERFTVRGMFVGDDGKEHLLDQRFTKYLVDRCRIDGEQMCCATCDFFDSKHYKCANTDCPCCAHHIGNANKFHCSLWKETT